MLREKFNAYVQVLKDDKMARDIAPIKVSASMLMIPGVGAAVYALVWYFSGGVPSNGSLGFKFMKAAYPALAIGGAALGAVAAPVVGVGVAAGAALGAAIGAPTVMGAAMLSTYGLGYALPRRLCKMIGSHKPGQKT